MTIEAGVQCPRFLAVVRSLVQRLALVDASAQHRLVLAMGDANLDQTLHIDAGGRIDEAALVDGALGEALEVVRRLDGGLVLGHTQLGDLLGRDAVGRRALLSDLRDLRLGILVDTEGATLY